MFSLHTYRITDQTLADLEMEGLDPDGLKALSGLKNKPISSKSELLGQLNDHPFDKLSRKRIVKLSRRGVLRLDRIITNRTVREWVEAFLVAAVLAIVLRTFVLAPFKIPSGSMIPTIMIGDHIFASMSSYGLPIPLTGAKLFRQDIGRGDIVIFPYPLDPSKDYIKRVIGLGGDVVEVRGLEVEINGIPLVESYAYYDPAILDQLRRAGRNPPDYGPVRVPPGNLFVMGDNRFNSSDSRVWGFVDASTVKGRGLFIYWSHDPGDGLFGGYNLGRIGTFLK